MEACTPPTCSARPTIHFLFRLSIFCALSAGTLALPQGGKRSYAGPVSQGIRIGGGTLLAITIWNTTGCPAGDGNGFSVYYGIEILADTQSCILSRPLDLNELLDWSTYTPGQGNIGGVPGACTLFEETANLDSNNNPLNNATCYPIKNGQDNCFNLWTRGI